MEKDKKTIWIVDDSNSTRILIKNALKSSGHNILEIATADEAIEKLKTEHPDLIITDNNTNSQQNGSDVVRAAQAKGVKVIMVSATPELNNSAIESGATAFFSKTEIGYAKRLKEVVDSIVPPSASKVTAERSI